MLQKNLQVIEQAIAESRAALGAQTPQSRRDAAVRSAETEGPLLQDTIALMNEMRKGDAAGRGADRRRADKSMRPSHRHHAHDMLTLHLLAALAAPAARQATAQAPGHVGIRAATPGPPTRRDGAQRQDRASRPSGRPGRSGRRQRRAPARQHRRRHRRLARRRQRRDDRNRQDRPRADRPTKRASCCGWCRSRSPSAAAARK